MSDIYFTCELGAATKLPFPFLRPWENVSSTLCLDMGAVKLSIILITYDFISYTLT